MINVSWLDNEIQIHKKKMSWLTKFEKNKIKKNGNELAKLISNPERSGLNEKSKVTLVSTNS